MAIKDLDVIIETRDATRVYPGITALKSVNYRVYRNKVNVLIGENGAGKSTMMRLLAGVETPSSGHIFLNGSEVLFDSTQKAEQNGIAIIFQELNLFANMSVMDNIFIAHEKFKHGSIDVKDQYKIAKGLLKQLDLDIDPNMMLGDLGVGHRQMVEIARAMSKNAKVLIMDEPTSALSQQEVFTLFKVIRQLKDKGVTIIYISHRLEELMEIGDCISIFRDGQFIDEKLKEEASIPWIIEQMVGSNKKHFDYQQARHGDEILKLENITAFKQTGGYLLDHINFSLKQGEIVGIYGLLGAGRTELFNAITGLLDIQNGNVLLEGKNLNSLYYQQRLQQGIAFVPEDRQKEGVLSLMSIKENMTLTSLCLRPFFKSFLPCSENKEKSSVIQMVKKLSIKIGSMDLPITSLSGGNQQKVVLGKELMINPKVILLDEPTRGIDVGAKVDVYHQIVQMANQGLAVVFSSSELDEVMALSDRVIVLAAGKIAANIQRDNLNKEDIIKASTPVQIKNVA